MKLELNRSTILGGALLIVVLLRIISSLLPQEWPDWIGDMGLLGYITIFLGVITALVVYKGFLDKRGKPSAGAQMLHSLTFFGVIIVFFLLLSLGWRWLMNPTLQARSDIRDRVPEFMVYEVEGGVKAGWEANQLLHPDDCRPKKEVTEVQVDETGEATTITRTEVVPHEGFDYLKEGTCWSPIDKTERMRPVLGDDNVIRPSLRSGLVEIWTLIWGDSSEEVTYAAGCPRQLGLHYLRPGDDKAFCMEAGRTYTLLFDHQLGNRAKIRFDGPVSRANPELTLSSEITEVVDISYYGNGAPVTDSVVLKTDYNQYKKHNVHGQELWFEVYIEDE